MHVEELPEQEQGPRDLGQHPGPDVAQELQRRPAVLGLPQKVRRPRLPRPERHRQPRPGCAQLSPERRRNDRQAAPAAQSNIVCLLSSPSAHDHAQTEPELGRPPRASASSSRAPAVQNTGSKTGIQRIFPIRWNAGAKTTAKPARSCASPRPPSRFARTTVRATVTSRASREGRRTREHCSHRARRRSARSTAREAGDRRSRRRDACHTRRSTSRPGGCRSGRASAAG